MQMKLSDMLKSANMIDESIEANRPVLTKPGKVAKKRGTLPSKDPKPEAKVSKEKQGD